MKRTSQNYEVIIDDRGTPGIEIDDQAAGEYRYKRGTEDAVSKVKVKEYKDKLLADANFQLQKEKHAEMFDPHTAAFNPVVDQPCFIGEAADDHSERSDDDASSHRGSTRSLPVSP